MIIGETASTEYGGSKAAWITDMLSTQIPLYFPKLKGFLWFEKRDCCRLADRNLHHLEERLQRRHQIHLYAANSFAALGNTKIAPLR